LPSLAAVGFVKAVHKASRGAIRPAHSIDAIGAQGRVAKILAPECPIDEEAQRGILGEVLY